MKATNAGAKIKQMRVQRRWSRRDLAVIAGVSERQIQGIECGDSSPRLVTLERLAGGLGCSPVDLIGLPGEADELAPELRELLDIASVLPADRLDALLATARVFFSAMTRAG